MGIGESVIFSCCLMLFVFGVLIFLWAFLSLSSWIFQKMEVKFTPKPSETETTR